MMNMILWRRFWVVFVTWWRSMSWQQRWILQLTAQTSIHSSLRWSEHLAIGWVLYTLQWWHSDRVGNFAALNAMFVNCNNSLGLQVKYLVDNGSMTMIDSLNGLSCSPTGVTPLHIYCYRMRASNLRDLTDVGSTKLNDKLVGYYGGSIPANNWEAWLNKTALSVTQKNRINGSINNGIRNIVLAVLQYIMNQAI